jgi:hypothetical protein
MSNSTDPQDFIDPDEGRELLLRRAYYAEGEPCENCGTPCLDGRVHVPGFDFLGCADCAEEARAVIFAEENCPTLYDAVMRSKSVQQVRTAMKQHEATCPKCNPKLRKPAEVAEMPAPRKEAA